MAEVASVGLSGVASALARRDWQVRVRVHEPELRMAGAGIRLCENGLRSLCLIGAEDQAVRDAKQVKEWAVVDGAGGGLVRRTFTQVSLAAAVSSGDDVAGALRRWEDRGRRITNHVQRWSHGYGWMARRWPDSLTAARTRWFLQIATGLLWVVRQLNRAARHMSAGSQS